MKRSTAIAVIAVIIFTFLFVAIKLGFSNSKKEVVRTVLSGKEWLNTQYGIDRVELKNNTTLIVFWNISNINCKRTIKAVNEWKRKYGDSLQVVGVHAPEFSFEKVSKNVIKGIEEQKIKWPVVLDNDNKLLYSFGNEYWPSLYLVNKDGIIVYRHNGDGDFEMSDTAIYEALKKNNPKAVLPEPQKAELTGICFVTTPDIYCGTQKGTIANKEGYLEDKNRDYKLPSVKTEDSLTLKGKFRATKEYLESSGQNPELVLNFAATEVNLVADLSTKSEAVIEILLNGKPLNAGSRGKDLGSKEQVKIKGPGVYQLLKNNKKAEKGTLTIKVVKGDIRAYAFRFYGCVE